MGDRVVPWIAVVGYRTVPAAPPCPYCHGQHLALADDGDLDTLHVRCWCGAVARIRRDAPDLAAWPDLPAAYLPPPPGRSP